MSTFFAVLHCPLLDWEVNYVCGNKRISGEKGQAFLNDRRVPELERGDCPGTGDLAPTDTAVLGWQEEQEVLSGLPA